MTNLSLIKKATELAVNYFEANHIYESTSAIRKRVTDWYNNSDIADAEMLAAAAIEMDYNTAPSYDTLLYLKEFYFPTEPIEVQCFHIKEITDSLNDLAWM